MSDVDDLEFVEHLRRENSYAQAFMADTRELQTQLVSEMKSRVPAEVRTPPERWGPWSVLCLLLCFFFFCLDVDCSVMIPDQLFVFPFGASVDVLKREFRPLGDQEVLFFIMGSYFCLLRLGVLAG